MELGRPRLCRGRRQRCQGSEVQLGQKGERFSCSKPYLLPWDCAVEVEKVSVDAVAAGFVWLPNAERVELFVH